MARKANPLLGRGERLTGGVVVPTGGSEKKPPYRYASARRRVSKFAADTALEFGSLPGNACPGDEAVAILTMHPRYISKSDFPRDLMSAMGARPIGSRSTLVRPEKWGIKKHPEEGMAEEFFVAAPREKFADWAKRLPLLSSDESGAATLQQVEGLRAFSGSTKLRSIPKGSNITLEVAIHNAGTSGILRSFSAYVQTLGGEVLSDHRVDARGLTFVPVRIASSEVSSLADFSFVRVARGMPQLRPYRPVVRSVSGFGVTVSSMTVQSTAARALILDGGIPEHAREFLSPAVRFIEPTGIGEAVPSLEMHGLAVTSAFLFGSLVEGVSPPPPICPVDHVRVLDKQSGENRDIMYLDVLTRIVDYLDAYADRYQFVNISLGPDLAVEDDEITAWTALLDERFAGGTRIATVAVGNSGELDRQAGLCRIQPPADGVNVISVGACDVSGADWKRASYSSIGPGRTPGRVKPDGMAFGGSDIEPFHVLSNASHAVGTSGTSFAAPLALKIGRAHV